MSDFILKIFPAEEAEGDKTAQIREGLIHHHFLSGEEFEFYGETYLRPGDAFCSYFDFEEEKYAIQSYKEEIRIKIVADGYGVAADEEAEDFRFFDRKNVVEIWNADGNYLKWDRLTALLQQLTGDVYTGGWEIL